MLSKLRLENFRGFDEHEVKLASRTLLVGANNAGKSTLTLIEALRLVSLIANRPRLRPRELPTWTGDPGVSPERTLTGWPP